MDGGAFDDVFVPSSLVDRLIELASERPDDIAIEDADGALTYRQWVARAGALATRLAQDTETTPIAILVDRSVRSVVAIVAVQWVGRAVVPLDGTEPQSRLRSMMDRAGVGIVIDVDGSADAAGLGRPVVSVDAVLRDGEVLEPRVADVDAISTVFFTSGSTGEPKAIFRTGVGAEAVWRGWHDPRLRGSWSHVGAFAPLNFVAGFMFAILMPALGHRVSLVDLAVTPLTDLPELFRRRGVDCMAVTPSLVHVLRVVLADDRLDSVRHVMTFGEGLEWSVVGDLRAVCAPDVTVQSFYGSSEILGITIENTIGPDVALRAGVVPLGTPLRPETIRLEPVEGSDGLLELVTVRDVAPGYLDEAGASSGRFGVDPDGVPFWRSGDLVVVDDEGLLEFRGRLDEMLKVSGRLVEPAEIEGVLAGAEGVRRAVVVPHSIGGTRSRLVAHIEADATVSPESIRSRLAEHLPVFLVPSVLVRHDQLPVTDRGKVDRMELRTQPYVAWSDDRSDAAAEVDGVAAAWKVRSITGVIASVIDVPDLEPDDNLWHVGCDSLGALEILEVLNDAYDAELTSDVFITAATPRAIAEALTKVGERPPYVVFNGAGTRPPVHLVAGAGGPALQYRSLIWGMGLDQPVIVHEQAGLHQRMRPDRTIDAHAARSALDVLEVQPTGPYFLAGHSYGGAVALEVAVRLKAAGHEPRLLLLDPLPLGGSMAQPAGDEGESGSTEPSVLTRGRDRVRWMRHRVRRPWIARGRRWLALRRRLWSGRRIGSRHRYEVFLRRADRFLRGYRPSTFDGPTLVLTAEESLDRVDFGGVPGESVVVPGGHLTMLYPPHSEVVAMRVREFVDANTDPAVRSSMP